MTINTILLVQLRAHLRRQNILPLIVAAIPGIPLGVYILKYADVRFLEMLLGGTLLVVFSLYFVWSGGKTRNYEFILGLCRRLLLRLPGRQPGDASGPPVIIYTALQPWHKDEIKSTLTSYFFLSGLIIIAAQASGGLVTTAVLTGSLISIPFIILGVILGSSFYRRLETRSLPAGSGGTDNPPGPAYRGQGVGRVLGKAVH